MASGYVEVPEGWQRQSSRGFGPFVTREVFRRPDGTRLLWDARWHRKHAGRVQGGSTWWAPFAMAWWIGVLFAVGSICFALGSFPPYVTAVGSHAGQHHLLRRVHLLHRRLLSAVHGGGEHADRPRRPRRGGPRSLLRMQHRRIDWWAAAIQLLGTLWFNRTTLSALLVGLGASSKHHPIWRPDALGSVCFLVSSWLAWAEECDGPFAWRPSRISWRITALNLVGSVAFGVSAVASYVTSSGQLLSLALTNLGTFVGAVCFLAGAVLLLPERTLGPDTEPRDGVAAGAAPGASPARPGATAS